MSSPRQAGIALMVAAILGAFAWLLGGAEDGPTPTDRGSSAFEESPLQADLERKVVVTVARAERRDDAAEARREHPRGEPGPPAKVPALFNLEAEAEPVAREFFAAFARYEAGKAASGDRRAIAEKATPELAFELVRSTIRVPPGIDVPEVAELGRLELVPVEVEDGRVVGLELVGELERSGESKPVAIELVRNRGAWLVAGLGR